MARRDPCRLNDRERRLWVQNDEGLYRWFRAARVSERTFIRENRVELDAAIKRQLGCKEK